MQEGNEAINYPNEELDFDRQPLRFQSYRKKITLKRRH